MAIRFTIKPGGAVKIEPLGYTGPTCHKATQPYEARLEGRQTSVDTADAKQQVVKAAEPIKTKST